MSEANHITILGAGLAGLSAGYYARQTGFPFSIYEARWHTGGHGATHWRGNFGYDLGAHRFHDEDADITAEIKGLLGDDLMMIDVPSKIYYKGCYIDFPLRPWDLLKNLGVRFCLEAVISWGKTKRACQSEKADHFESYAVCAYGRKVAESFLLSYSEKLWGESCTELSTGVSGSRLKGLDLYAFLFETFMGRKASSRHFDGAFYYPKYGFGMIADRLALACGSDNVHLGSKVTKVFHDGRKIEGIEIDERVHCPVTWLISSLPLPVFLASLDPLPEEEILELGSQLVYRGLILVILFLNAERTTPFGSVYFPEKKFVFTRISEPKNRSPYLAPGEQSSVIVEIPCSQGASLWSTRDEYLIGQVKEDLERLGWVHEDQIQAGLIHRLDRAYPVMKIGAHDIVSKIETYLCKFQNLGMIGRNGCFDYSSAHDQIKAGKDSIEKLKDFSKWSHSIQ